MLDDLEREAGTTTGAGLAPAPAEDAVETIAALWQRRIETIGHQLALGELQHREIANAGAHVSADYEDRFLVELLQNASDQATKAGLADATVLIVRAPGLVAVANQGSSMDDEGLKRISSLALSEKDPSAYLGNKGVGFKSVFRVSSAPEVFSAATGQRLDRGDRLRFRLDLHVFASERERERASAAVSALLARDAGLRAKLVAALGTGAQEDLLAEITKFAPPWKFPVPLERTAIRERAAELGLQDELGAFTTLVVLPVSKGKEAAALRAFADLRENGAHTMLFLPAVTRLELRDLVDGGTTVLERTVSSSRILARGARLDEVQTSSTLDGEPRGAGTWWRVSRVLGQSDVASSSAEQARIAGAAALLPGSSWEKVTTAAVQVALPVALPCSGPLDRDGLFCIGLPTTVPTGSAFWVDGHFHGNISRTELDFRHEYNALLLEEAMALLAQLVEQLRSSDDPALRLLLTLSLGRANGPVGDRLFASGGIGRGDVVLAPDGRHVSAATLRLPCRENLEPLLALELPDGLLRQHGIVLPHGDVLRLGWDLLEPLGAAIEKGPADPRFTSAVDGSSLLERAARLHRSEGKSFWEAFLGWVVRAFTVPGHLARQRILPIDGGELARGEEHVFLAPYRGPAADDDDDEIADTDMPPSIRTALRFLDEGALPTWVEGKRARTDVASRLEERKLAGVPRVERVIKDALAPRLAEAAAQPESRALAIELLVQALSWMDRKGGSRVDTSLLLVPTQTDDGEWIWRKPGDAYLGEGWIHGEHATRLASAIGTRTDRQLVPWDRFAPFAYGQNVEWWRRQMLRLGVADLPRIVTAKLPTRPLWSSAQRLYVRNSSCPFPGVEREWEQYLEAAADRSAEVGGRYEYEIEDVCFIEGLELPETREHVVRLILDHPKPYIERLQTFTKRFGYDKDRQPLPTFWAFALTHARWEVFPCSALDGERLADAGKIWRFEERRRRDVARLLPRMEARYAGAAPLLTALEIYTPSDAPAPRLVAGLHQIAALPQTILREHRRAALALTTELYDELQRHARTGADLSVLLDAPIPLLERDELKAVDPAGLERLYIDDDPVRARFVVGFEGALRLPTPRDARALVGALRRVLGAERVLLTSEAPTDVRFTPAPDRPERPFLEFLEEQLPDVQIRRELAAVLAYGGREDADPEKDAFLSRWREFESLRLAFGKLAGEGRAFYERTASERRLLVADTVDEIGVLALAWLVAGQGFRNVFAAFAGAVKDRSTAAFFREQRVSETEFERLERAIGLGRAALFDRVRSALFCAWRRSNPAAPATAFDDGFGVAAETDEGLALHVGEPGLAVRLPEVCRMAEEEGCLAILDAVGIDPAAWQAARAELGLHPWTFDVTRRAHAQARTLLVAALKADASNHQLPGVESVTALLASLPAEPLPGQLLLRTTQPAWLAEFAAALSAALPQVDGALRLRRRLEEFAAAAASMRERLVRELGTVRELDVYLKDPEPLRSSHASQFVAAVLHVGIALAPHQGEALDGGACRADPRVAAFSSGPFANKFAVLRVLKEALEKLAPKTSTALSGKGAFTRFSSRNDLWLQFPELGPIATPAPPEKTLDVFEKRSTLAELVADLARGEGGEIGALLKNRVDPALDLSALRTRDRRDVPEKGNGGPRGGGGGAGGGKARRLPPPEVLALHGDLGEAFVFEQFKASLPGWDQACWFSAARARYNVPGAASDDDGFDFRYSDVEGRLGGRPGAVCLIEVKASSGDGTGPFPLSVNEWNRAHQAHESTEELYLIIRVAHVCDRPTIVDIIIDPVQLQRERKLRLDAKALEVTVG